MRGPLPVWLLAAAALTLAACGGPVRLLPERMGTLVSSIHDRSDAFYCGIDTSPLGLALRPDPPDEQAVAGYVNSWDPGTEPAPCWVHSATRYVAAVKFPLEDPAVSELFRTRRVSSAELRFVLVPHGINPRVTFPIGHETCPLVVRRATGHWESSLIHVSRGDPRADVPGVGTRTFWALERDAPLRWALDVTPYVQAWDGGALDHGFIISPREDWPFRKNNDRCLALLQDFQLDIVFERE